MVAWWRGGMRVAVGRVVRVVGVVVMGGGWRHEGRCRHGWHVSGRPVKAVSGSGIRAVVVVLLGVLRVLLMMLLMMMMMMMLILLLLMGRGRWRPAV